MAEGRTLRSDARTLLQAVGDRFQPVLAGDGPQQRAVPQSNTTSVGRRLTRISVAVLLVGATLTGLVATGVVPMAGAGTPNVYSAPEWFPLRGSAGAQWKVGCTYHSANSASYACDGYHPIWALDLFQYAGAPVHAAGAGFATRQSGGGYGNYVVVDHGSHGLSLYGHLSSYNIPPEGAWVDQNDVVGGMGNSGVPDGSVHLHFERKAGGPVNSGWYTANSLDPGPLKACHGSSLVTYPQEWGLSTWEGIGWGTVTGYSDGTACSGSTTSSSTTTTTLPVTHDPEGHLDSAVRTDGGHIRLVGWASDADVSGPIQVQALVDGSNVGQTTANVGAHGFDFAVPADWRSHTVCAKALNAGGGVDVTLGGCTTVSFALCPDTTPTIVSTTPKDMILPTAGNDVIWATGGGAKIAGSEGNDIICGGGATGGPGGNQIIGGPGDNLIFTGPGNNDIVAGPGHTQVISGGGHNRIAVCPNTVVLNKGPMDEVAPSARCGPQSVATLSAETPPTATVPAPSDTAAAPTTDATGAPRGDEPVPTTLPPSAGASSTTTTTAVPTSTPTTTPGPTPPPTTIPGPTPAPSTDAVASTGPPRCGTATSQAAVSYAISGAGSEGVAVRQGPTPYHPLSYALVDGDSVAIVCYMDSVAVEGNTRWNRLSDGYWVADAYTTTPKR